MSANRFCFNAVSARTLLVFSSLSRRATAFLNKKFDFRRLHGPAGRFPGRVPLAKPVPPLVPLGIFR